MNSADFSIRQLVLLIQYIYIGIRQAGKRCNKGVDQVADGGRMVEGG